MARFISDNPGGWNRTLPTHAVEYDANYAAPWVAKELVTVAAGAVDYAIITIPDDDLIYFIDMISITPKGEFPFRSKVYLNLAEYLYGAWTGWANIPLSQNPSLQFISPDEIKVSLRNLHTVEVGFEVYFNGTKIPKPPGYTHGAF